MAEHTVKIEADVSSAGGKESSTDFLGAHGELDNQLKKLSLAFGRLSPECRKLGMTFRTLVNLSNAYNTSAMKILAVTGAMGLLWEGCKLL